MPGATFEPFDVVVVPFPFTDKTGSKRRPALVISTQAFNDSHDQLVLTMITAARQSHWPSDVILRNWRSAGLAVACRVRFKLFTLDKALIVRRLGALANEDRESVRRALLANLAAG
ncbi:MAG: type II toxin-antitoxin system PemK/MazF family toxin [Caulobacteraceae bacterium]